MLNTEIGKTGEVIVEGHTIGRLEGFMFAPETAEAGSDAKALQAAAQKALAGEIDGRAEKLANAPDDQFVLASDGTLRWTGDAVGKLMAADEVLHPRVRIVADERLSGAPRDAVQARLDLWLKTHIEKLLPPLFEITRAEDITGIARGIAFQLVEGLGVLERPKIAAELKDLDQASRASLRKYGVRFGAYHIYIPTLLKPAARALASLLWALKHDDADLSALAGVQHLAASGRTSFPADPALNRDAYRVLGYRLAGDRAVRVDILERLADLIRPALAWREGSAGEKPAGAFDGRGFVVTQAMTSLAGSAGESFASILKALGYRMELRPPLPPAPATEAPAAPPEGDEATAVATPDDTSAVGAETTEEAGASAAAEGLDGPAGDIAASDTPSDSDAAVPEAAEPAPAAAMDAGNDIAAPVDTVGADAPTHEPGSAALVEADSATPSLDALPAAHTAVTEPDGSASGEAAPAETAEAAPAMVEVWRPAGRFDHPRSRHGQHRGRHGKPADDKDASGDNRDARRHRHGGPRKPRRDEAAASAQGQDAGRPPRERFRGKGKGPDKSGFKGAREHGKSFGGGREREQRDRPIDPNSPFAKLAALKDQLAASNKDN